MLEGKTKSGFNFKIDERVLHDVALYSLIGQYDEGTEIQKIAVLPKLVNLILGAKGYEALEKHLRKKNDGFCTMDDMQAELVQIIQANKETKNS